MQAIADATALNATTESLVITNNRLSETLFRRSGLTRFSENIEAGARIAELVVLMIADNNEPKNRI
jgi:hypothetical protein